MQSGRQILHILQHNPRLDINTMELKLKLITLKKIQLHKNIMQ